MSEISMYEAQLKRMQGLCDEHDLTYSFKKTQYPISFTIRPLQGVAAQMSMLAQAEDGEYISPDASMTWIFENGVLSTKVQGGTFTIGKTLRTKIETVLIKMITYWQQYFFRDVIEKDSLRKGMMPVIKEDEANDEPELPEGAEPLEELVSDGELPEIDPEDIDGEPPVDAEDSNVLEAIKIVRMENKATVGLLQRRLGVGYAKAARIMDTLEALGVIGPFNGSAPREVLPYDEPDDGDVDGEVADNE